MRWIAEKMRRWADRIDHAGAPRALGYSFTFETGIGIEFHEDPVSNRPSKGCRLWYLGHDEYEKAYTEAVNP